MQVQFNTDNNISGSESKSKFFTTQIEEQLNRFEQYITRIEVFLTDEDGKKNGKPAIRCVLEARLKGRQPIAVTNIAETKEQAVSGAIDKLWAALDTIVGRINNH